MVMPKYPTLGLSGQLREQATAKPDNYSIKTIDLATAHTDTELSVQGDYILVKLSNGYTGTFSYRLNEVDKDSIDPTRINPVSTPFRRLYYTNTAVSGATATLYIGRDAAFATAEGMREVDLYAWDDGNSRRQRLRASSTGGLHVTQSERRMAGEMYEKVIDAIGGEFVRVCLPLWEGTTWGQTYYDLLSKAGWTTQPSGAATEVVGGYSGLLHNIPYFRGTSGYLRQPVIVSQTEAAGSQVIDNTNTKAGQKLTAATYGSPVGFVRLKLQRVGTLASATLKVTIEEDSAGAPSGTPITNGTSATLAASVISNSEGQMRGFTFVNPPLLDKAKTYWLVLQFDTTTGVDGSNNVVWSHDGNVSGYSGAYTYAGSWSALAGSKAYVFDAYDDLLNLTGDFSIIAAVKYTGASGAILGAGGMTSDPIFFRYVTATIAGLECGLSDGGEFRSRWHGKPEEWTVVVVTFTKASSTSKNQMYVNGRLTNTSGTGTATNALVRLAQPLCIGGYFNNAGGAIANLFTGYIGPVIITTNALTAAQIGKVTNYLLARRRYQESI